MLRFCQKNHLVTGLLVLYHEILSPQSVRTNLASSVHTSKVKSISQYGPRIRLMNGKNRYHTINFRPLDNLTYNNIPLGMVVYLMLVDLMVHWLKKIVISNVDWNFL